MLDLLDKVLETLIVNTVAPVIAQNGRIDDAVKLLKRAAVQVAIRTTDQSKQVLAKHFGMSDRWLYRHWEEAKAAQIDGRLEPRRPLVYEVADLLEHADPTPLTVGQIAKHLQERRWRLERTELEAQLRLYVDTGLIEPVRVDGGLTYRMKDRITEINGDGLESRLARIGRAATHIVPNAVAYARGDEDARFSVTKVSLPEEEWAACVADIQMAIRRRLNEALERALQDDPLEQNARNYVILFSTAASTEPPSEDQ